VNFPIQGLVERPAPSLKKTMRYKVGIVSFLLAFLVVILPIFITGCKKTDRTSLEKSGTGAPSAPNMAYGVKIKKEFDNISIEIEAGTLSPNRRFGSPNIFQAVFEKKYVTKLTNLKINIVAQHKFINIRAGTAFCNEEFTSFRIKGIMSLEQKGFNIKREAKNIDLSIKNGKIIIESVI
jgi:hypothetical protein